MDGLAWGGACLECSGVWWVVCVYVCMYVCVCVCVRVCVSPATEAAQAAKTARQEKPEAEKTTKIEKPGRAAAEKAKLRRPKRKWIKLRNRAQKIRALAKRLARLSRHIANAAIAESGCSKLLVFWPAKAAALKAELEQDKKELLDAKQRFQQHGTYLANKKK